MSKKLTNLNAAMVVQTVMDCPVGRVYVAADDIGLILLDWNPIDGIDVTPAENLNGDKRVAAKIVKQAVSEMKSYFAGELKVFSVPLNLMGTEFQKSVWNQLLKIPYGETWTYADIARRLNNALAIRAVGSANGRNPVAIIVPCHRVINTGGGLGGYSGGLDKKTILLKHENTLLV